MNTPLPDPNPLQVVPDALDTITAHVRQYGQQALETGGFLLTAPGERRVRMLAVAGSVGIVRGEGLFIVTAPALDQLFTHAEQNGLQVRAMIHSHPAEAFLSETDRRYSLRVRGFINAVVPDYATPTNDPAAWGWWRHETDWIPCPPIQLIPDGQPPIQAVTFDVEGLHAHPD